MSARDPWELEDPSSYSLTKFYTAAGEKAVSKGVRYPLLAVRMVEVMVQSGEYPRFGTFADFVRDAVYHRLQYLRDYKPEPDPMLRLLRLHQTQAEYTKQMLDLESVIKGVAEAVADMRVRGHYDPADAMLRQIYDDVEGLQNDYWKTYYLQQLRARFGPGTSPAREA